MAPREKIAVILAAHGEAETTRFIENYQVARQTLAHAALVMPIPKPVQRAIAVTSSLKKKLRATADAQSSPQNRTTRDQAVALQQQLDASSSSELFDFEVHAAFSASPPYVEHIIEQTRSYDGQVIVSMAPVDSSLSCGLLCSYLSTSRKEEELGKVKVLSRFWNDERLYAIYCDHIFERRPAHPSVSDEKRILLLLFHGTLVADTKGKTPQFHTGLEETRHFARHLRQFIQGDPRNLYSRIETVYLNHNVGGEWTKPSFEESCAMLRQEKIGSIDLFAGGYFADGNETIHRAAELTMMTSIRDVTTIPCVNTTLAFTDWLTSRVLDAVQQLKGFS
jgi:protoporphyrin/coproporphyrin ferrochelatase